jgi:hypothetical protein
LGNLRGVFSFLSVEAAGKEHHMAKHGNVKDSDKYEALRRKGMSKTRAAKISNAGKSAEKKGGRNSHKG